ncbi:hypothetical protein GCM10010271_55150 [Streptomyces kurssanovii]|nr:hypothetical protein GCM10010271_55150 [Streptomyces kurssanovii]
MTHTQRTTHEAHHRLNDEQRRRLGKLGVKPHKAVRARTAPAKAAPRSRLGNNEAFQKGLEALQRYMEREDGRLPPRAHIERLPDGTEHRTGIWIGNQKARRDRLDATQLATLAELGISWAR